MSRRGRSPSRTASSPLRLAHSPAAELLLRTVGRRTSQPRTSALLYVRDGDAYVVIASNGGAPQHPGWFHNLTAQPDVEIQVGRARIPVRAQVAAGEERSRLWARADEVNQASTPRTNPVRAASSRSWCSSRAERSGPRLGTPG